MEYIIGGMGFGLIIVGVVSGLIALSVIGIIVLIVSILVEKHN